MKIAIQGHSTRGKEVIQLFKDLGTEGLKDHTGSHIDWVYLRDDSLRPNQLIVGTDITFLKGHGYKVYTLEEFEKEFPFKIGDKVKYISSIGIIKEYCYINNEPAYKVKSTELGIIVTMPAKILKPYKEMERNITLTIDKAKEWYKKGGELKEVALQAFTEKELNSLPRSWDEFCRKYEFACLSTRYSNFPLKYDALFKLEQLRDCWWNGWEPEWNDENQNKYCIRCYQGKFKVNILFETRCFLSFPTHEMAKDFLEYFRDLIETAGDLI